MTLSAVATNTLPLAPLVVEHTSCETSEDNDHTPLIVLLTGHDNKS